MTAVRPALRRFVLVGVAALLVAVSPAGAQFRWASRDSEQFRPSTTLVTLTVPVNAFDPATGLAVVPVTRAVLGELRAARPWTLRVRADRAVFSHSGGSNDKSCEDLAIRATGQPSFQPLTTNLVPLLSGDKTQGWRDIAFDLRLTARLTDAAGTYTLNLQFDFN